MQDYFSMFYPSIERPYQQPAQTQFFEPNAMPGSSIDPSMQTPTGYPTGPAYSQIPIPTTFPVPLPTQAMNGDETVPETVMNIEFTQGYLKTQIGKRVKVEFLIGTNMLIDREGTLVDVGASYIVIREVDTDDLLLCDMYSIKFVRFYY